jgi:hypothetical protein
MVDLVRSTLQVDLSSVWTEREATRSLTLREVIAELEDQRDNIVDDGSGKRFAAGESSALGIAIDNFGAHLRKLEEHGASRDTEPVHLNEAARILRLLGAAKDSFGFGGAETMLEVAAAHTAWLEVDAKTPSGSTALPQRDPGPAATRVAPSGGDSGRLCRFVSAEATCVLGAGHIGEHLFNRWPTDNKLTP